MKRGTIEHGRDAVPEEQVSASDVLDPLVNGRAMRSGTTAEVPGVVVGELIGITDGGIPLVAWPGPLGLTALPAQSVVDLHGSHIGRPVALVFDGCDVRKPIVIGVVRDGLACSEEMAGHVDVDADGRRLIVTATEQLVLRCGKASITLTKSGKVLIEGTYVSTRASGVNRVKGGSVQIN